MFWGEQGFEEGRQCWTLAKTSIHGFLPIPQNCHPVFPGFLRKWQDETLVGAMEQSIHWYVESNVGGVDGAIIQQISERLAWVLRKEKQPQSRCISKNLSRR